MPFTPRFDSPSIQNKYYRHTGYFYDDVEGLNECKLISSNGAVMPNCVGYTWGRAYECYEIRPTLSKGNASGWWNYNDGYERIYYPYVGSVVCWVGGNYGGHVGFIEAKNSDEEYITSNSYYNSKYFTLEYMRLDNGIWKRYRYEDNVLISNYTYKNTILLSDNPEPPPPPIPPQPIVTPGSKMKMLLYSKRIL